MYYARGIRDLIGNYELSREFFEELDSFHLKMVDLYFQQAMETRMGLFTELEAYNFSIYQSFLDAYHEVYYELNYLRAS